MTSVPKAVRHKDSVSLLHEKKESFAKAPGDNFDPERNRGDLDRSQDSRRISMDQMSMNNNAAFLTGEENKDNLHSPQAEAAPIPYGGMHRHEAQRIDRLGKEIKSKRERQPNGQKKRLHHKVTFRD